MESNFMVQPRKENIGMASYIFVADDASYQVSLDSLHVGHENWVYSVEWKPPTLLLGDAAYHPLRILSASMCKMMMIWRSEKNIIHWINLMTLN
jgi:elongator complex protein 2